MGDTYTRQSSYTDGDVITAAHTNDEFNQLLAAFAASSGHTHDGTVAEGGPITKLLGNGLTFGAGTAGTDITITFDGENSDGVLKWMEDEDHFLFMDDVVINSTQKLYFFDEGDEYIYASTNGQLDIVAGAEVQIVAPAIDINGNVDVSGTLTVAGAVDFGDAALSNVGAVQLDSISGDADTDTSITFSGSNVITVANAGTNQVTFNDGSISPVTDSDVDLGTTSLRFKDVYIDSATVTGEVAAASLDISGNIDVDGVTNLDVVDIDGAVNMATTALVTGVLTTTATQVATGGITSGSNIISDTDSTDDLGTTSVRWANLYVDAITATDQITATGFTGTLDGILGSGSAAAATVTTLDTSGAVNLNLTTDSTSSTSGALIVDGGVGIAKKLYVGTDLDVDGTTNLDVVDIDGAVDMASTLAVAGVLTGASLDISGDIDIDGTANLDIVDIDGAVDMATTLTVAGNVDFNGDLDVDGTTNLDVVDIDGAVDMASTLAVAGVLTGASLDISGDIDVDGTTNLDNTDIDGTLVVDGSNISLDSTSTLNIDNSNTTNGITIGTATSGVPVSIGHTTSETTVNDNLTVTGDFTVNGTTTTVATTNMVVADNLIELNNGATSNANDSGIVIERGSTGDNAIFMWDESADTFVLGTTTATGASTGSLSVTDGALQAGSLDISGDIDVDGTLEADAITLNGTALGSLYSPIAGGSGIVTTGALNSGSITSGFGTIDNGASAITTTGVITGGTLEATTDTAAGDNAAIGYTAAEGLILTGQGSTSDITLKNDADAVVFTVPTGTLALQFPDNAGVKFGAGADLQIYHTGSQSVIAEGGTGNLLIQADELLIQNTAGDANYIRCVSSDESVQLRFANSTKIATASGGIDVTGTVTATGAISATSFTGSGGEPFVANVSDTGTNVAASSESSLTLRNTSDTNNNTSAIQFKNSANTLVAKIGSQFVDAGDRTTDLFFATRANGGALTEQLRIDSAGTATFNHDIKLGDNGKAIFGTGSDLEIYHDGTHSYVKDAGAGSLQLQGSDYVVISSASGAGEMISAQSGGAVNLKFNNSNKLVTTATGIDVTGDVTLSGELNLTASSNNYIDFTDALHIRASGSSPAYEDSIHCVKDAGVSVMYNGSTKIATSATGVTVTGTAVATTDTDTSNTGSVTLDFAANQNFVLTLTGNVTLANPSTEQVGQSGFITLIQDGTGGRTLSLGTDYETAGGAGITLTSTASATDIIPYVVAAAGRILLGSPQLAFS